MYDTMCNIMRIITGYIKQMYISFLFSIIIFALYIICTENTNKEIIINVMLSTQSHGATATISSELHGASLCLANVVSGPWNIPSTQAVLCVIPSHC